MVTTSSATALNLTSENEESVYPCWCGEVHRGTYGREDWNHHNCFHREDLVLVHEDLPNYWICCCGQTFNTEP